MFPLPVCHSDNSMVHSASFLRGSPAKLNPSCPLGKSLSNTSFTGFSSLSPCFLTLLTWITPQLNYFHAILCLRLFFQGNLLEAGLSLTVVFSTQETRSWEEQKASVGSEQCLQKKYVWKHRSLPCKETFPTESVLAFDHQRAWTSEVISLYSKTFHSFLPPLPQHLNHLWSASNLPL